MISKDTITKVYMKNEAIFADAFNFFMYSGKQVIKPEDLHELDTAETAVIFGESSNSVRGNIANEQRYRDVLKSAVFKRCGDTIYAVLGIENQSEIHYAMPVRNMIYDALQYGRQVNNTVGRHRNNKDKMNDAEFLSGFRREDHLTPVVTLVIYYNSEKWDGPMSIHEMIGISDPELMRYVQDYRINLISPADITSDELKYFSTSLGKVLGYIKYSKDKDKLLSYVTGSPDMKVDIAAARVINTITKANINILEREEKVDMCKAIEDLINDSKAEGRTELIKKTLLKGRSAAEVAEFMDISLAEVQKVEKELLTSSIK